MQADMRTYQVTFDENGNVEKILRLSDPEPRKRVLVVRETSAAMAQIAAKRLYTTAQ
jgi:hypothetical protein